MKQISIFFFVCIATLNNLCVSGDKRKGAPGAFAYFIKKPNDLVNKADKNSSSLANDPFAQSVGRQIYPGEGRFKVGRIGTTHAKPVAPQEQAPTDKGVFFAEKGTEDYFSDKTGFSEFKLESVSKKQ